MPDYSTVFDVDREMMMQSMLMLFHGLGNDKNGAGLLKIDFFTLRQELIQSKILIEIIWMRYATMFVRS